MDASTSKRPKQEDDRISNLPDSILCHILSFLTTLCSVRTSCLSRRWRYLWASVPALDFEDARYDLHFQSRDGSNASQLFVNFVNTVFKLHTNASIRRFRLHLSLAYPSYSYQSSSYLYSWIWAASKFNVEELDVIVDSLWVNIPDVLYQSKKLISLKLSSFNELNVPQFVNLPSLKLLHLCNRSCPPSASMNRIISGCPVLEDLAIDISSNRIDIRTLYVVSSSLKRFELRNVYLMYHFYSVNLNAPQLRFLHLSDVSSLKPQLEINVFSSITKASFDFKYCSDMTSKRRFVSLFVTPAENCKSKGHFWSNLTQLAFRYCGADLNLLPIILKCMPNLQDLELKSENCNHSVASEALQNINREIHCLKHSLKVFKLRSFEGKEADLQITEYILKRAKLLKEVIIYTENEPEVEVLKKLLLFPRSSETCRIAVNSI